MVSSHQVRWLFVDFNAYFASVEQQENPALRGKPVGVVPMMSDSTCCIAASYEAKAFGIKTGTNVAEARSLCPSIRFVEARHGVYVKYHHALVDAVDECIPVESVLSIDEMACRLTGSQQELPNALSVAAHIKQNIRLRVGEFLKCSIGLAPNRYLAKVAGDMRKPDGLTVIRPADLPLILWPLKLRDLPGIGRHMEERLSRHGIHTMKELCSLECARLHEIWGGVVGDRFYSWLRGEEPHEPATQRRSVGHSHVLEPQCRSLSGAYKIAQQLTAKAAVRLRRIGCRADGMSAAIQFLKGNTWAAKTRLGGTQDTPTFLKTLSALWDGTPPGIPLWVGVTFFPVTPEHLHTPSLFDNPKQEHLCEVMDQINERWGRDMAYYAALKDAEGRAPSRIAFTRIPDLREFDEV